MGGLEPFQHFGREGGDVVGSGRGVYGVSNSSLRGQDRRKERAYIEDGR